MFNFQTYVKSMYTSKFTLTLKWLLFIIGFYIFWALSYLVLAKFALSQVSRFKYSKESIWAQLTASDIFWYAMFVFGIALVIYVIRKLISYSPNRKIAALIFGVLVIVSVSILVDKLLETTTFLNVIPHILINTAFLVPMGILFFQADRRQEENEDQDDTEYPV